MRSRTLGPRIAPLALVAVSSLMFGGCLDELVHPPDTGQKRDTVEQPEMKGTTAMNAGRTADVVTSTHTATITKAGVEVSRGHGPALDCRRDVKWTQLQRCQHEGMLYATGVVSGVQDIGLARTTAAERARRALVPPDKSKVLEDSEVVDFVRCFGTSHALARVKLPADVGNVPACDVAALASKSPLDPSCPEWVRAIAWKSDGTVSGVGAAKLRNTALADATAANRARAEIQRLVHEERSTKTHGHEHEEKTEAAGQAYSEIGKERAVCDGVTYVKIVARGTGSDPCGTKE